MRIFTLIWLGQLVYLIGIWMTGFALDISVFKQTGSATQFALLILTCTIPPIIISPLAGTLVDRWDRRSTMIISHICTGLFTLVLLFLVSIGQLAIWHIYLRNICTSIIGAFNTPAYKAAITSLVPQKDLSRASGMVQLAIGIQQIISPLIAGALLDSIHLQGILIIDFFGLLTALTTLILVKFSNQINQPSDENDQPNKTSSLWREIIYGWTYLTQLTGLPTFVIIFTFYQFLVGFVSVLVYPLILRVTTPDNLGKIAFISGLGMILGSIVMSSWKLNWQNLISPVLIGMSLNGLWIAVAGSRPSLIQIGIATLFFFMTAPVVNGLVQMIFQIKVAENVQGRVFALTGAISGAAVPLAAVFAGPLADYVFEPLMAFDGPWSKAPIGQLIGTGPGRGTGLLFVIVGCSIFIAAIIASQHPAIRKLEVNSPEHPVPSPEQMTVV
ncbi:MFS transporter [Cronbergia sp. UHCC 0137]|uniref:MFS transporter n=1 Tax=Cronbergia sp. UHCC 0137 TaxID=3110239 RepID=UPI002B20A5AA|nr:MFS transporter [Cronbergia sp. UHCC 0137]MEA5616268.1 MFS transporter [Cronbergia sp. UHCC 0137]